MGGARTLLFALSLPPSLPPSPSFFLGTLQKRTAFLPTLSWHLRPATRGHHLAQELQISERKASQQRKPLPQPHPQADPKGSCLLSHQIKLSEAYTWTRKESSEVGEDLGKVIELGLQKPVLATDVVGVVVQEVLREQSRLGDSEDKLKLLLAADEFNGFFNPCAAHISKFEPVSVAAA